jgi:hypothetical protein
VEWLDKGYLPLGKLTGIIGDPGLGKTTLTYHLVACLTRGWAMPGGTMHPPANVVIMSAEDGLTDTIKPRLRVAGADLSLVTALRNVEVAREDGTAYESPIFLPRDLPSIRREIEQQRALLLVIDPLLAYLDPAVNSYRDQDVRTALAPLARLAEETRCAVLLVRHLTKGGGGNTLYRGGGSIGITGAERAELIVAADPDDTTKRVLAVHKHNLHKPVPALRFELREKDEQPYVVWLGESPHTAARLLAIPADEESRSETDEAVDWLRDLLQQAGGQMPTTAVQEAARKEHIADKVLRLARMRLCEKPRKEGFGGGGQWVWKLQQAPEQPKMPNDAKNNKDALSADEGTLAHLRASSCPTAPDGRHETAKLRNARGQRLCIHCEQPVAGGVA